MSQSPSRCFDCDRIDERPEWGVLWSLEFQRHLCLDCFGQRQVIEDDPGPDEQPPVDDLFAPSPD